MERLSFFPSPYPDECLYSIFARYYVRSGISSSKEAARKLFGSESSILASTVYLPHRLERMDYWISPLCGLTSKDMICDHTSYPYQSIAYMNDLYKEMEMIILNGVPKTGMRNVERRMIAKNTYHGIRQYMRYCPECAREDVLKYGETYWHRLPQLPGVEYCPEHGCRIIDSEAPFEEFRARIYPASYMIRPDKLIEGITDQKRKSQYMRIAEDTQWLLEHGREFGGQQKVSQKYRKCLKQQGYANFYGICDREAVKRDFLSFFGVKLIEELFYFAVEPLHWLHYLKESIGFNFKPIHHVLLMEFFAGSAEQFLKLEPKPEIPYGSDSGLCINMLCKQYLKLSAKRIQLRTMGDEIWAWFECPHCGFRYRRSNPEQSWEDYMTHPCITDRGFLYREKLEKYLKETELSMKAIANKLGVSPASVAHYARNHGINRNQRYKSSYYFRDLENNEDRSTYYRRRIIEELKKTPIMSCKDLKERVPGAYEWFIRKEPEWINGKLVHEFDKPRWTEWGASTLAELKAAYKKYRERGDPRKRITIGLIARTAGVNRDLIDSRLPYLPEMQKFFDEVCETQEEWIRRRYTEIASEKKAAGGKEFTYNDVKRKVNLKRGSYDRNKAYIDGLIEELNNTLFKDED